MIENHKKEKVAHEVIRTLYSRFENFPENASANRNAPFHEAFLNAFSEKLKNKISDVPYFISLSSWLHGLNTTLGQSFFENVAHILSDGEKKTFTKKNKTILQITEKQKKDISDIITDLKNGNNTPNLLEENEKVLKTAKSQKLIEANDFTVDVFYETNEDIVSIELKSVRPNAGEMRGEKQKILEAKAALFHKYNGKNVVYYIGFPFDPTSIEDIKYDKTRFLDYLVDGNKYFDKDEVLLSGELWNFLSETPDTMKEILDIINNIATPNFMDEYGFLNKVDNQINSKSEYLSILVRWKLFYEQSLINYHGRIMANIDKRPRLLRIYKQSLFDNNGKYRTERANALLKLI